MFNKKRIVVFVVFLCCLFFMTTFAGGTTQNTIIATRLVTFMDSFNNSTISSQNIEVGTDAQVPSDPYHDGYIFGGWYLYEDQDVRVEDFTNILNNLTVIAKYAGDRNRNGIADDTEANYTVTFIDSFDGSVIGTESVLVGMSATAPSVPAHDGYTFTGWDNSFANVTGNITVRTVYTNNNDTTTNAQVNYYTVNFIDTITNQTISSQTVQEGLSASTPNAPTHEGYLFVRWNGNYSNVNSNRTIYTEYVDDKNNNGIDDLTESRYTVTFSAGENGVLITNTGIIDVEYTVTNILPGTSFSDINVPVIKENKNYLYTGWDTSFPTSITENLVFNATYADDINNNGIDDSTETEDLTSLLVKYITINPTTGEENVLYTETIDNVLPGQIVTVTEKSNSLEFLAGYNLIEGENGTKEVTVSKVENENVVTFTFVPTDDENKNGIDDRYEGTLTVRYVSYNKLTEDYNDLIEPLKMNLLIGEEYHLTPAKLDFYTVSLDELNPETGLLDGVLDSKSKTVMFIYTTSNDKNNNGIDDRYEKTLTVRYVSYNKLIEDYNDLIEPLEMTLLIGEEYHLTPAKIDYYTLSEDILDILNPKTNKLDGVMGEENETVMFIYTTSNDKNNNGIDDRYETDKLTDLTVKYITINPITNIENVIYTDTIKDLLPGQIVTVTEKSSTIKELENYTLSTEETTTKDVTIVEVTEENGAVNEVSFTYVPNNDKNQDGIADEEQSFKVTVTTTNALEETTESTVDYGKNANFTVEPITGYTNDASVYCYELDAYNTMNTNASVDYEMTGTSLKVKNIRTNTICKVEFENKKDYTVSFDTKNAEYLEDITVPYKGGSEVTLEAAYGFTGTPAVNCTNAETNLVGNTLTISNVTDNSVCSIEYSERLRYNVEVIVENGTNPEVKSTEYKTGKLTFPLTTPTGYKGVATIVNCENAEGSINETTGELTVTNVTAAATCTLKFNEKEEYDVNVTVENGTVDTPSKKIKFEESDTFEITPIYGYESNATVDCGSNASAKIENGKLVVSNVTGNTTCTVTYGTKKQFNVTLELNGQKTVEQKVPYENRVSFEAKAPVGFTGNPSEAICTEGTDYTLEGNKLTINSVEADTTCNLIFNQVAQYKVSVEAINGTEVSYQMVNHNEGTTFNLTPATGYKGKASLVSCTEGITGLIDETGNLVVSNVTKDGTCKVEFTEEELYTVNLKVNNGTYNGLSKETNYSGTVTFENIQVSNGFESTATIDCGDFAQGEMDENGNLVVSNVTNNGTCTITFGPRKSFDVSVFINEEYYTKSSVLFEGNKNFTLTAPTGLTGTPEVTCDNAESTINETTKELEVTNVQNTTVCNVTYTEPIKVNLLMSVIGGSASPSNVDVNYGGFTSVKITASVGYTTNGMTVSCNGGADTEIINNTIKVSNVITEQTCTVTLLSKPEVKTVTISPETWTTESVTLTVTETKVAEGLEVAGYSFNGNEFSTDNTFEVSENGTVVVTVKDSKGNISDEFEVTVTNIDKFPPIINAPEVVDNVFDAKEQAVAKINLQITDDVSGIEEVTYLGEAFESAEDYQNSLKNKGESVSAPSITIDNEGNGVITIIANGTYTIYAKDRAGREVIRVITVTNIVEKGISSGETGDTYEDLKTAYVDYSGIIYKDQDSYIFGALGYKKQPERNITVRPKEGYEIIEVKWAVGAQNGAYFESDDIKPSDNTFTATGIEYTDIYTIYIRTVDENGVEQDPEILYVYNQSYWWYWWGKTHRVNY